MVADLFFGDEEAGCMESIPIASKSMSGIHKTSVQTGGVHATVDPQ